MEQDHSNSRITESACWNLSTIFKNKKECESFLGTLVNKKFSNRIESLKNQDPRTPKDIKEVITTYLDEHRKIDKAYTYSHLQYDTLMSCPTSSKMLQSCKLAYSKFMQQTSWVDPKIIAIPQQDFKKAVQDESLKDYANYLEKIYCMKTHTLSSKEEKHVAKISSSIQSLQEAFSLLTDVEMKFEDVEDVNGEKHALTNASYGQLFKSKDRILRKNTFNSLYKEFKKHNLSIGTLLTGSCKYYSAIASIREFESSMEAFLKPNQIPVTVYSNLIKTVNENLDSLHDLFALKKTKLGLDDFSSYDTLANICTDSVDTTISFESSVNIVKEALAPLGEDYISKMINGIKENKWIHVHPQKDKRSGAYSSGCYDSHPFILLNFLGSTYDMYVLAHELGHSMHSLYSRETQNYANHSYPIFLAEIASTVNEFLLSEYLIKTNKNGLRKEALQNYLELYQSTLFRQTMFAEFEQWIHDATDKELPITYEDINKFYLSLVKKYMGEAVKIDDNIQYEWSRIPHFYSSFYVYQYATGVSIAQCIAKKLIDKEPGFLEKYISFLKSGCSASPVETIKLLGVNITQPKYIQDAIHAFREILEKYKKDL